MTPDPPSPDPAAPGEAREETSRPESGPEPLRPGTGDPDLALVRAASSGDRRAFESLVLRHQDRVYTRIFFLVRDRELAADLAQETLLKAWRGIGSFRGEALFSTWLGRIAVNATRHHFERAGAQKRRGKVVSIDAGQRGAGEEQPLEITDRTHLPAEWAQRNERQRAILRAVGELEEDYRTAFALRDLHGYSYREIMDTLDLPIGTVKSRIFRARKILQEKLKDLL